MEINLTPPKKKQRKKNLYRFFLIQILFRTFKKLLVISSHVFEIIESNEKEYIFIMMFF